MPNLDALLRAQISRSRRGKPEAGQIWLARRPPADRFRVCRRIIPVNPGYAEIEGCPAFRQSAIGPSRSIVPRFAWPTSALEAALI